MGVLGRQGVQCPLSAVIGSFFPIGISGLKSFFKKNETGGSKQLEW
jgi:hypothetical protein